MKRIILILFLIITGLFGIGSTGGYGEAGSKVESFQVKVKLDLIKDDNTTVNIYNGDDFIEVKADGNSSAIADMLSATMPPNGKYRGIKITTIEFKKKAKIKVGGVMYYTKNINIPNGQEWNLTTDETQYGYTTTSAAQGGGQEVMSIIFPKILNITGSDTTLYYVNRYKPDSIKYETESDVEHSHWIGDTEVVNTFMPSKPEKEMTFEIEYSKTGEENLTNKVTIYLDENGDLTGAHMMRPRPQALNGSFMIGGEKSGNEYKLNFRNGDDYNDGVDGDDYYEVKVSLDCNSSHYSDLIVYDHNGTIISFPHSATTDGYILKNSGTATCSDVTF